ncbi:MAG: thioredoxin domain-containing protein [Planctomycetaceae bacterium]
MSLRHSPTPNRLQYETSPYLLQHAHNPVDWYPWGDEAFAAARAADKPIFLSVGYSACHWCHVMEHESFENDEIARFLNLHFISIKVDREERPDIDQIYMTAVQLLTHRGGWPMSVFMTADGDPYYGGTYWPPTSRMGMPGFLDILKRLNEVWTSQREEALQAGQRLTAAIQRVTAQATPPAGLSEDLLRDAEREILDSADRTHGGFGGAPKFPHPMDLRLLLRCYRRFRQDDTIAVARLTLHKMASGGIYDHLGGGFHRYSTDAQWLAPHFEKMLYDNALLVPAYLEAWQITGEARFREVVVDTLEYILREMTQPGGGFYATQDADSEGVEGKFFVWNKNQIIAALGGDACELFSSAYDVTPGGNWEGHTILRRVRDDAALAVQFGLTKEQVRSQLAMARRELLQLRGERIAPGRDDKVLTDWNGLMIAAMAFAGRVLADPQYVAAAVAAARFLLDNVRTADGRLLHGYKDGQARLTAYLSDYAGLLDGLAELFQATGDAAWLATGVELAEQLQRHYAAEGGGYYQTAADHESLIARTRDQQDNATPSGNGLAATALIKLGRLAGRGDIEEAGYNTLVSLSGLMHEHPRVASQALMALDFHLGPSYELEIVDPPGGDAAPLAEPLRNTFLPHLLFNHHHSAGTDDARPAINDQRTYYLCERGSCRQPTTTWEAVLKELQSR